jgi:hypothetical protein
MDPDEFIDNVNVFFMALGIIFVLLPVMIGKFVKFLIE